MSLRQSINLPAKPRSQVQFDGNSVDQRVWPDSSQLVLAGWAPVGNQ